MDLCPLGTGYLLHGNQIHHFTPPFLLLSLLVRQLLPSAGLLQVCLTERVHSGLLASWQAIRPVRQRALERCLAALGPSHGRVGVPMRNIEVTVLHGDGARLLVVGLQLAPGRPPDGALQVGGRKEDCEQGRQRRRWRDAALVARRLEVDSQSSGVTVYSAGRQQPTAVDFLQNVSCTSKECPLTALLRCMAFQCVELRPLHSVSVEYSDSMHLGPI